MMIEDTRIQVYGHEWAQDMLQSAVLNGRTSHAYLFTGPDQVGKTTLARAFAQALTCEAPEANEGLGACGRCRACRLAATGGHPDHRFIFPSNGQIKIEQVRDLIHEATLSPVEGRFKVFIISAFDRANTNAANALLKTLEEPTDSTRILLTSNQAASLLPTITSRCQALPLRLVSSQTIAEALQSVWGISAEQAELLAGLSEGRLGWAVQMATEPTLWQARVRRLDGVQELGKQNTVERLAYAEDLAKDAEIETTLRDWLSWWRDVLLVQEGCDALVVNRDQIEQLRFLAESANVSEVRRFLEALMTTAGYMRRNVNVRLAVEALLLKAPRTA